MNVPVMLLLSADWMIGIEDEELFVIICRKRLISFGLLQFLA